MNHSLSLPALVLALTFPSASLADGTVCELDLTACDFERDSGGTCPLGSKVTAQLFAEGELWWIHATNLATGDGASAAPAETQIEVRNAGTAGDGTRFFFVAAENGLDGALTLSPDNKASLQLYRFGDTYGLEDYYDGHCAGQEG